MNSVNATLRDRILLRAHYLSRFETSQYRALLETLQEAHDSVIAKIAKTGGKDTKSWLEQVLVDVDGIYAEAFKAMGGDLNASMKALSKLEAEWAAESQPWEAAANIHLADVIDPRDTRDTILNGIDFAWGTRARVGRRGLA